MGTPVTFPIVVIVSYLLSDGPSCQRPAYLGHTELEYLCLLGSSSSLRGPCEPSGKTQAVYVELAASLWLQVCRSGDP